MVLVSGALLTSGLVEAYFVYTENQAAVIRLQRERAVAAASTIEQYLRETEHVLGWLVRPTRCCPALRSSAASTTTVC